MGTEQEIFDSAIAGDDDDLDTAQQQQQPPSEGEAGKPPSDAEQAAREPQQGTKPEAAQDAARQQEQPQVQHQVPLKELLDTRERAQAAERRAQELERRFEEIERQRRQSEDAPKRPTPDQLAEQLFAEPETVMGQIFQAFEERLEKERQNRDFAETQRELAIAKRTHGAVFDEAWTNFVEQARHNPALEQAWRALPVWQRGDDIVAWHKQQQLVREVGSDPAAYRQRLQDDLLKDPAFVAKVIESARGQGQPNGSRPSSVTRLPSLSRATAAASAHDADDGDDSEDAIWEAARDNRGRFASR